MLSRFGFFGRPFRDFVFDFLNLLRWVVCGPQILPGALLGDLGAGTDLIAAVFPAFADVPLSEATTQVGRRRGQALRPALESA